LILDASALVAVLCEEPGHAALRARIGAAPAVGIGVPTMVEAGMVLRRLAGERARWLMYGFLLHAGARILPFTEEHWHVALDAFEMYGKGRHPAALNFGDCLTYATAKVAGEPLLYLGNDFAQTDIAHA
jgi:ribonuclease VapC